jgi:hypothetical protein
VLVALPIDLQVPEGEVAEEFMTKEHPDAITEAGFRPLPALVFPNTVSEVLSDKKA